MDVVLQAAVCRVRLLQPVLHVLQLALEAPLHLGNKGRDTLLRHNITFFSLTIFEHHYHVMYQFQYQSCLKSAQIY